MHQVKNLKICNQMKITDKSHYAYIKDFNSFMCNKAKIKNKHFCRCFSSKKVLIGHKKSLNINHKQSIKLRSGSIKFKNYFKQIVVPFKIYADFESVLKGVQSNDNDNNAFYTKKYQKHIPCSFAHRVVCIDDRFSEPVVLYRGKNAVNKFIEAILKENECCKKMIKNHFNKNLVMSAEDERSFKSSNRLSWDVQCLR